MTAMVAGVYKEGKIELLELPRGVREGRVRVLVIEDQQPKPTPRYLVRGKYRGSKDVAPEDFKEAEWHGEEECA
jgi:hypothetical protein